MCSATMDENREPKANKTKFQKQKSILKIKSVKLEIKNKNKKAYQEKYGSSRDIGLS
jgi:hypothetical protein